MIDRLAGPKLLTASLIAAAMMVQPSASSRTAGRVNRPLLIAHRGASGYTPEHTVAAYELAIKQGADFVEQDLQLTKDGVLVSIHDPDLSRTTDVAAVFPDRATVRDPDETGTPRRGWYTIDFTLAEIKRLDAGSWFNRANPFAANPAFAGLRVPTMEEVIRLAGERAGLYIELKHFTFYKSLGFDAAAKLADLLKAHGFARPVQSRRIFVQSFHKEALLRMRELAPEYPRIQLLPMEDSGRRTDTAKVTPALAAEIAAYARGVGPAKNMITGPEDVATFHNAGLLIHPYTFRGATTANARRPLDEKQANGSTVEQNIVADIARFLGYGIDGGFTDYPDLWKRAASSGAPAVTEPRSKPRQPN